MNHFTPRAQQTLALARKEASRLNHEPVSSGHLLLGMIRLHQGTAIEVLLQTVVGGLEPLQKEIERMMGPGTAKTVDARVLYDMNVKRVLAQAGKEARSPNHSYIGTEHLLLGMLTEEGVIKDVLESFGATLENARSKVLEILGSNISPRNTPAPGPALMPMLKEITSDAIRYWERRRVVYNIVLAMVVMIVFFGGMPLPYKSMSGENVLGLFVLAVGANVVFCSAYLPDFFAQLSEYRAVWRRLRWMLFVLG